MSATELKVFLGVCRECGRLYLPDPGHKMLDGLPCGHVDVGYHAPASIISALADSEFVQWASDNDVLEGAIDYLHDQGGDFDPYGRGFARFTKPGA